MHAATPATSAPAYRPHDGSTVFSIATIAYELAKFVHEGLGHGITCELVGGRLVAFSSSWAECEKAGPGIRL